MNALIEFLQSVVHGTMDAPTISRRATHPDMDLCEIRQPSTEVQFHACVVQMHGHRFVRYYHPEPEAVAA